MFNFNIENFLANFSFFLLFLSMIFYWIKIGLLNVFNQSVNSSSLAADQVKIFKFEKFGIFLSNIFLFSFLILRWKDSGHFPLSNLYESLMFLSWSITLFHIVLERISNNPFIGAITAPCALFTNAFATFSLPSEIREASPLVPALQSNWLMMHVTVMILSYAALITGSLLSIAFLIITRGQNVDLQGNSIGILENEKKNQFADKFFAVILNNIFSKTKQSNNSVYDELFTSNKIDFSINGQVSTNSAIVQDQIIEKYNIKKNSSSLDMETNSSLYITRNPGEFLSEFAIPNSKQFDRSKLARTLDNLSYRVLGIGFPFLTIGILSGAVWANEAWGSYWSWDPKETWALLTWFVFAIYLHTRLTRGWQGKKPAILATLGFFIVWICFLGVNLLGEGLHSYGWLHQS